MANKKQKKLLLIMLIILAVIAIAFFGATAYNKYQANHGDADAVSIATVDNINAISYNNGTSSLSFALNDDKKWYYKDNADFPLQSSYLETLAQTIRDLKAVQVITPSASDKLSDYGLDNPQATITVSNASGQTASLLVGNTNSDGYYLKLSNNEKIYTIDSQLMDSISKDLYAMGEVEDIPAFDVGKLSDIQIGNTKITVKTTSSKNSSTQNDSTDTSDAKTSSGKTTTWYSGNKDVSAYSQISALSYNIPYLSFNAMCDWKPTAAALASYGLDNPISAVFNYTQADGTKSSYTLLLGKQKDSDYYYATTPNSDRIYTIATTDVAAIVSIAENGLNSGISLDTSSSNAAADQQNSDAVGLD